MGPKGKEKVEEELQTGIMDLAPNGGCYEPSYAIPINTATPCLDASSDGDLQQEQALQTNVGASTSQIQCLTPEKQIPYLIIEDVGRRTQYLTLCVPLYRASIKGDWKTAKAVIDEYPGVVRVGITKRWDTALHVAAAAKRLSFVKELIKYMTKSDLQLRNKDGNTAICFAAASGFVEIAKVMVEMNEDLPLIRGNKGMTPLYMAALFGHRDMVLYLYSVTIFGSLTREERIELLLVVIAADLYDVALEILEEDPSLASARNRRGETALHVLARKPSIISSASQHRIWIRWMSSCFKGFCYEPSMKVLAHQLVQKLWEEVVKMQDWEISNLIREPTRLLFDAAEVGNIEFLIVLIRAYPDLIWKVDEKNRSLFHIAVLNRHESIFNLIYEIGAIKDLISLYKDKEYNNMLHLAGNLASSDRLHIVSGAALQMQRELIWFKEVEKIVPPSYLKMKNSKNQTPKDLFTEMHKQLLKDAGKWMKATSTSCMLVATLIATVVFAAAFTIPGGDKSDSGTPIFQNEKWFTIFVISDAIALFSSSTSIITFLSILTSRFAEEDFFGTLPSRLMFGLLALFIAIASMVLAFSATFFVMYDNHKAAWIPILIISLACLTVTLFVVLHVNLWVDTIRSTYCSTFLFQRRRHRLC